jgi:hypothetical protein
MPENQGGCQRQTKGKAIDKCRYELLNQVVAVEYR